MPESKPTAPAPAAVRPAEPVTEELTLSEGDRQELETYGVVNIGGRQYTTEQVRARLSVRYRNVEIKDAPEATRRDPASTIKRGAVRGVDFVYPSIAPGRLDPAAE